jgi:ribulose-phosphate 3-epimerase
MHYTVIPSLPAQSFRQLQILADALKTVATCLQVDIVDGKFVPLVSWPFTEANDPLGEILRLRELPSNLELEVDCMVKDPLQYLDTLYTCGVRRIIIHYGSTTDYEAVFTHARTHRYTLGLAFTNDYTVSELEPYLASVDFVQVMGIKTVGAQGLPFDERTLSTVRAIRTLYPELPISVDGAVNQETILRLKEAGANRFAPGSAVAKAEDPAVAYKQLCALVGL